MDGNQIDLEEAIQRSRKRKWIDVRRDLWMMLSRLSAFNTSFVSVRVNDEDGTSAPCDYQWGWSHGQAANVRRRPTLAGSRSYGVPYTMTNENDRGARVVLFVIISSLYNRI